ncbi:hypothetical protein C8D87_105289 [Lentzea atacamensis]|uniref:Uncharacterized protein n=1 Tax=Lentzea atacamensis TaxID=531938 RepID=A0ABX9E9E2_9PSEU|nr:hypothetical protein [Lentzea atacamensis]RAS64796.1 hypothetical protein C8D87_105289 [Lentzea atacamensis]
MSALRIQTADGTRDHVVKRIEFDGAIQYRLADGPEACARLLVVEPHGDHMRLRRRGFDGRCGDGATSGALRLRLGEAATGTIDGHPQIFPAGDYRIFAGGAGSLDDGRREHPADARQVS